MGLYFNADAASQKGAYTLISDNDMIGKIIDGKMI